MGSKSKIVKDVINSPYLKGTSVTTLKRGGLKDFVSSKYSKPEEVDGPFLVLDLGTVTSLMEKWNQGLPNITPFYAVKCNPDPAFLRVMAALGASFECVSKSEIEAVLAIGVPADGIIFAHTCKPISHIKYAASVGVNLTTFDSIEEVKKIARWHPKCALLLRVKAPNDKAARWPLGSKFGALPEEVEPLLRGARAARLTVAGVAFHVGSGVIDSKTSGAQFDEAAAMTEAALNTHFKSELPGLRVWAEPGRFFAETSFKLVANIIGRRVRGTLREYWINDGLYGTMSGVVYDGVVVTATPLAFTGAQTYNSTVFGPTMDSLDTVLENYQLPEMQLNDWLVFPNMGAYTIAVASSFNGFKPSSIGTHIVIT